LTVKKYSKNFSKTVKRTSFNLFFSFKIFKILKLIRLRKFKRKLKRN
jgi:hypothetical protein